MVPAKVKELPIEYPIDKDLLKLVSEANAKYGEYKSCLKNVMILYLVFLILMVEQ